MENEVAMAWSEVLSKHLSAGTKENNESLGQYSRCPDWDLSQLSSKYNAEMLTLGQIFSVSRCR
jgi:hypothetical protein